MPLPAECFLDGVPITVAPNGSSDFLNLPVLVRVIGQAGNPIRPWTGNGGSSLHQSVDFLKALHGNLAVGGKH